MEREQAELFIAGVAQSAKEMLGAADSPPEAIAVLAQLVASYIPEGTLKSQALQSLREIGDEIGKQMDLDPEMLKKASVLVLAEEFLESEVFRSQLASLLGLLTSMLVSFSVKVRQRVNEVSNAA